MKVSNNHKAKISDELGKLKKKMKKTEMRKLQK